MTSKNMNIGAHFSTDKGLIGAVDACETINGNAIQVFFKSPMNMKTKIKLTDEDAEQTKEAIKESGIFLVTHGSYLLNLCNPVDKSTKWLRDNLIEDLEFADKCGSVGVIIHMGSQNVKIKGKKVSISYDEALGNMVANIREILNEFKGNAKIILETCSAEGAKIAKTVEQFCQLYNSFTESEKRRIGLCVDTCHIFVAGYPINLPSGFHDYFKKFDNVKVVDPIQKLTSTDLNSFDMAHLTPDGNYVLASEVFNSFVVEEKDTGKRTRVNLEDYLTRKQLRTVSSKPDCMWQFAQRLKSEYAAKGKDIAVYVNSRVKVNGRPYQQFTDPNVDLANTKWDYFGHATWIMPSKLDEVKPMLKK